MRIVFSFFLIFRVFAAGCFAQDVVTSSGQAQVEFPDFKSKKTVENEALELAIVNALEAAFGRAVIEGNSTYVTNLNSGQKTQTSTVFNMIANTYVKGEVIEILDQEFREITGTAEIDGKKKVVREVRCNVKIRARELPDDAPEFLASPRSCPTQECTTADFKNDQSIYFAFRSPVGGYLSVFLDDGKVAQRLLPYSRMTGIYENGVPVNANQDYLFFSRTDQYDYFGNKYLIDEYQLYTESPQDQNRIFILFSQTPIETPALREGLNSQILTEFEKDQGFRVPRSTESEKFQDWLIKSRLRKKDLSVKMIDITITK